MEICCNIDNYLLNRVRAGIPVLNIKALLGYFMKKMALVRIQLVEMWTGFSELKTVRLICSTMRFSWLSGVDNGRKKSFVER